MADSREKSERKEQFRRGMQLLQEGRPEEATDLLEPLHEQEPDNLEITLNLGGAYILQRRYEAAAEILEVAAEKAPDNANLWVNLAAARLGPLEESTRAQQDGAIEAYERALDADPGASNVHYMLGLIYRARNNNLRAVAHFARALEQDPGDKHAQRMLSAIAAESVQSAED